MLVRPRIAGDRHFIVITHQQHGAGYTHAIHIAFIRFGSFFNGASTDISTVDKINRPCRIACGGFGFMHSATIICHNAQCHDHIVTSLVGRHIAQHITGATTIPIHQLVNKRANPFIRNVFKVYPRKIFDQFKLLFRYIKPCAFVGTGIM